MHDEMRQRIRDVLTTLTSYHASHLEDIRLEAIVIQLESVQDAIGADKSFTRGEKDALDFNLVEGTPLEGNERLATELQSIKNFAMNAL